MKEFIKKFLGFSVGPVIGALISFITVPVTSHLVSADQFGLANMFTIANNIVTLIVLIGIDQAFIREYNENKDKSKLLCNSLLIPIVASIIIGIGFVVFRKSLALILFDNSEMIKPIILLAVCTPLFIIEKFMLISLRMQEKALQYSLWNIASKLLNLIIVVLLLLFYRKNFESIIYATIYSQLIISAILMYLQRKNIKFSKDFIDWEIIKSLLKFGVPLVPATVIGWGLNSMDSVFLRAMSNYTELGYYSVALKVSNVLGIIQSSFSAFWTPLAFKWKANNEKKENFEIVSDGVALIMSIILILILLFKNIIPLIFGEGYGKIIYIIPFLMFYPIFYTMSETTTLGIYFSKKTYYNIIISIISVVVNLILNYILIPTYHAVGAAIATGISYLVFFWARTIISRKLWYKFKIKKAVITTIVLLGVALLNCIIMDIKAISIVNIIGCIVIFINYRECICKLLNAKRGTRLDDK